MSTLTAYTEIQERSEATPGLWNRIFSTLSDNIRAVHDGPIAPSGSTLSVSLYVDAARVHADQAMGIGPTPSAITTGAMTIAVSSAVSDYIHFEDSSGGKSDYLLGSRVGGTADGLNLWDLSGNTMIASFSKQSVRFYQQVVGPVFDLGGALTGTYNAATFGTAADSDESRIQAAINQASIDGIPRVYIPQSMLPYSASSISFIHTLQMIREGGDASAYDVVAYGSYGSVFPDIPVRSSTSAIQAAINTGKPVEFSGLAYQCSNLSQSAADQVLYSSTGIARLVKDANGAILKCDGARVQLRNLSFRGESATPSFTSHNVVATGADFQLVNCGSRWAFERAVKAIGGHTQILGTCDIYQTTQSGTTGYDIELGVSGIATLYHEIEGVYSSQAAGGILATDVGGMTIVGGQYGKLSIASGTLPVGTGANRVIGGRINGDITIAISGTALSAIGFSGSNISFAGNTSLCVLDAASVLDVGTVVTNNGNANNLIIREVATGSYNILKFGQDSSAATLRINPTDGSFRFPAEVRIRNQVSGNIGVLRFETSSAGDGPLLYNTGGNAFTIQHPVSGGAIDFHVTGASGVLRFNSNSAERLRLGASSLSLSAASFILNQNRVLSMRTLAASSVTVSAANTNVAPDEVVFTVGGASGASLCIHSGGSVYIFNSDISAKAT